MIKPFFLMSKLHKKHESLRFLSAYTCTLRDNAQSNPARLNTTFV